jgi:hypothetical protein
MDRNGSDVNTPLECCMKISDFPGFPHISSIDDRPVSVVGTCTCRKSHIGGERRIVALGSRTRFVSGIVEQMRVRVIVESLAPKTETRGGRGEGSKIVSMREGATLPTEAIILVLLRSA